MSGVDPLTAYLLVGLATAILTSVALMVADEGEDAIATALFGALCGLGWPLWLFAVALAAVGNLIARAIR